MLARQIAIGLGIALIFPLLIYYGVSTFSHAPKWNDFQPHYVFNPQATGADRAAQQTKQQEGSAAFANATRIFSFRLLCVAAPLGYAAILLGGLWLRSGLGAGLIFGGIFAVIDGYWLHWAFVEDWLRFISLLVALAVLLTVSFKQVRRNEPNP